MIAKRAAGTKANVAIVLPTLNEEKGVGRVLDRLQKAGQGRWNLVVADGGSTDRTAEIARANGATVLTIAERGKGRAIRRVFQEVDADYLVIMDGDASYPPEAIPKLLVALEECDVVIGSRFHGSIASGAMTGVNKLGNQGLTLLGNILYGKNVSDVCSGMWGFRRNAYQAMEINAPHFEVEVNFFTEAARRGFKICEVPIAYEKREGEAKLRVRDGVSIGLFLLKKRF